MLTIDEYLGAGRSTDGIFTGLLPKLIQQVAFDRVELREFSLKRRVILWFRHQGKSVLKLTMLKKGAKFCFRLCQVEPQHARNIIAICRDHFDEWFGITKEEIQALEDQNNTARNTK